MIVNEFINQAETFINAETRFDWVTAYSTLDAKVKKILDRATSSLAAMDLIAVDMSPYPLGGREAETMLDYHRDVSNKAISMLKDIKSQEFAGVK